MSRVVLLLVIVAIVAAPAGSSPCRSNDWQPTYVHDLVNDDGIPYYVMPDGRFVALTGDWASQSGPGMCCLYGVRDRTGFTNCFEYTRIQCGCDLQSVINDTCRRFLQMRGSPPQSPAGMISSILGRWRFGREPSEYLNDLVLTDRRGEHGYVITGNRHHNESFWRLEKSGELLIIRSDGKITTRLRNVNAEYWSGPYQLESSRPNLHHYIRR